MAMVSPRMAAFCFGALVYGHGGPAAADPLAAIRNVYLTTMDQVVDTIAGKPEFTALVTAQSKSAESWSEAHILDLDKRWRAGDATLIDPVLANPLSKLLSDLVATSNDLIAEIIVMDQKGCNVAVSSRTSDYWQGDEAKWQKTFGARTETIFIDRVDFDQSTRTFSQQFSKTLSFDGRQIGAITIGFDIRYKPAGSAAAKSRSSAVGDTPGDPRRP